MSVIEDSRKLLQDFVAPELRAIDARLSAVEKRLEQIDGRFTAADKVEQDRFAAADKVEQDRFAAAERIAAERHERVLSELKQLHSEHDLELRIAKIEAMMGVVKTEKPTPEARQ